MNLNHDPDKHLLDQIDKLIETKQPSGSALLDELATTRPIPRPTVQTALEERLLAQLETLNQGETAMASTTSYMPISAPRRNWLPLTLLAALIVVAIAGLMLINGIGKSPKINEMALANGTSTVTVTSTTSSTVAVVPPKNDSVRIPGVGNISPLVVAVRDIPRGTVLSSRWLSVIYTSDDTSGMYSDPELLRGLTAKQDIPRWQPILPRDLTDQIVPTSLPTAIPKPTVKVLIALQDLPRGYKFPELPLYDIAAYADWPADSVPQYALLQDERGVQKLWGKTLQADVSLGQPILISDISGGTTQNLAAPTSPAVHNTNIVQIRLSALTSDSLLPGVGGSVDVVALLPFKAASNIGDIPSTPMPDGTRLVETYVLRNTLVFYHGDRSQPNAIVAISVSVNESRILAWLAEQPQVMFRLQNPLPNAFDMTDNNTIVSIPFENVTATENIQPGDRVNVISTCAFVPDVMGVNNTVISSKTDCNQSVEETRAVNVQVFIGEIVVNGRKPVMTYDSISLVMSKDAVPLFTKLNDAKMHFKLVPATKAIQPTPTRLPSGLVTVDIPLASLTSKEQSPKLQAGDHVDVVATFKSSDAPPESQTVITPQPIQPNGHITQRVISDALIIKTGDVITLAVSPDAASLLQQWISAKLPITLRPVDPATAANDGNSPPTYQLALDSASRWATDDIQVGDTVDVVMGFVTGEADSVDLAFKHYGTLKWVDELSKGEVFARIYSPTNGKPGAGGIFMHRIIQNAEVIAINTYIDPTSGHMSTLNIIVELPASMTLNDLSTINDYIQAGLPYLVIKH